MSRSLRWGGTALLIAGALAACTPAPPTPAGSTVPPTSSAPAPSPTATPMPTPAPLPPLAPGTSRGELLIVQRAEDAALVSGAAPIRLTLARTGNEATWFTAPPQKLAGRMTTEQAMLTLGWRPAADGTTAAMPSPRPNGVLAHQAGTLAFTVQRANVRGDGTLVLDIRPMGPMPETVESFGPVSLTLDGAPGVLDLGAPLSADMSLRVIITGNRNQQAVIEVLDSAGMVLESGFVARDRPVIDTWLEPSAGVTTWSNPVVTFTEPTQSRPGTVRIAGTLTVDGESTELDQIVARWSLPVG